MRVHITHHFRNRVIERFKTNITEKETYLVEVFKKGIKEKIKSEKRRLNMYFKIKGIQICL